MLFNTNKEKGCAGMSMAIAYFGCNGYTVSIPLDDTQDYDLIVEKDNIFQKVQCKATGSKKDNGNYQLSLRNNGGTSGTTYGTVINSSADLLFALREDNVMYVIPIKELSNTSALTLSLERSKYANINSFDSSQYIVTM